MNMTSSALFRFSATHSEMVMRMKAYQECEGSRSNSLSELPINFIINKKVPFSDIIVEQRFEADGSRHDIGECQCFALMKTCRSDVPRSRSTSAKMQYLMGKGV